MESIKLLGIRVDKVTFSGTLESIEGFVENGRTHVIVTADASAVVIAQTDAELAGIINEADIVTPDSAGILVAAKWYGSPLPEKVSGVDLTDDIAKLAARKGYSIYLLGAAPGVAEDAGRELERRYPGLTIAGTHDGFFTDDSEVVDLISASGAKILFAAMGIPKQEKFIARNMDKLGVAVAMGVGGTFDVISGRVHRAPQWMRRNGLEWAYRLASNPRKITKVATLPRFLWMVLVDRFFRRKH